MLSLLMGMIKHLKSAQSDKFDNIVEKKVRDGDCMHININVSTGWRCSFCGQTLPEYQK